MAFPSTYDTFAGTTAQGGSLLTAPDHATDHRTLGSAVGTIEHAIGTTNGTQVLMNFAVGDFAARINSSNILQQPLTGTLGISAGSITGSVNNTGTIQGGNLSNSTIGTPQVTGGTLINGVINTSSFNNGTLGTPSMINWNGWQQKGEQPTVLGTAALAATLTFATGTTSNFFDKGDRVWFTQGGSTMYGAVIALPAGTTMVITGGTNYPYGTTAITNFLYSKAATPNGFPNWFDWLPIYGASGNMTITGVTTNIARFNIIGNTLWYNIDWAGTVGGTLAAQLFFTVPVNIASGINFSPAIPCIITNNGANNVTGFIQYSAAGSLSVHINGANWSAGVGGPAITGGMYQI